MTDNEIKTLAEKLTPENLAELIRASQIEVQVYVPSRVCRPEVEMHHTITKVSVTPDGVEVTFK